MFKSILYRSIVFIVLLIVSVSAFTYAIAERYFVAAILPCVLIVYALQRLYYCFRRHNTNILFLLNALDNGDYSFHFSETKLSRREKEMNQMLNRIKEILVNARKEVIENETFLSVIIENLSTGVIIFNEQGNVQMANYAAKQLLGLPVFTHIGQLKNIDESFPPLFMRLKPGESAQINIINEREETQLSLSLSETRLKKGVVKIVVFNNIGDELEAKEIESWIRLIRVMTHEIMNSIAPITSITETLLSAYSENLEGDTDSPLYKDTTDALTTIDATARGLLSFVESYRKFTGIPQPQYTRFDVCPLLENILTLESERLKMRNITTNIIPGNTFFELSADKIQITQVLVNLIKNAEEAIDPQKGGIINIHLSKHFDKLQVEIANNGLPISPDIVPHIFVPFFTTKETGTGIGLSISRYIMRLHGGNLRHYTKGEWTVFSMIF